MDDLTRVMNQWGTADDVRALLYRYLEVLPFPPEDLELVHRAVRDLQDAAGLRFLVVWFSVKCPTLAEAVDRWRRVLGKDVDMNSLVRVMRAWRDLVPRHPDISSVVAMATRTLH